MNENRWSTSLIVINQVTTAFFNQWLEEFSSTHNNIELWTGTPSLRRMPNLRVRRLPAYNRSSIGSRVFSWVRFTFSVIWMLVTTPRKTPVFATTNPPLLPLVLVVFYRLFGRPYAILEYDLYPQIMRQKNILSVKNPIYRLWWKWHRWSLSNAGIVITISEMMGKQLALMTLGSALHLHIITTWSDTDWLKPMPKSQNQFISEHNLTGSFIVLYSGNLGVTHSIETIVAVAERLKNQSAIVFLILGEGDKKAIIEEAIAIGRTPNIRLLPLQSIDNVPYSLSSADIAVVTLGKGYETLSMPSKLYDMMAVGSAILGISHPPNDLATTLERHQCGKNFSPSQVEEIACWIVKLQENRELLRDLRVSARKTTVALFSSAVCQPQLTSAVSGWLLKI